ncbi:vitellogenic carboxypeptidase-like [Haemaphysalis longicornis]
MSGTEVVRSGGKPCGIEEAGVFLTAINETEGPMLAKQKSKVTLEKAEDVETYSGYLTIDKTYFSNVFFLLVKSKTQLSTTGKRRLLLWIEGGPGESALFSMFMKNGPVGISSSGEVYRRNETSLNNHVDVIYVDSPVGAGYSFTRNASGYSSTLEDTSRDLYTFFTQFLDIFDEYNDAEFYVGGESYGARISLGFAKYMKYCGNLRLNITGVISGSGFLGPLLETINPTNFLYSLRMVGHDFTSPLDIIIAKSLCPLQSVPSSLKEARIVRAAMAYPSLALRSVTLSQRTPRILLQHCCYPFAARNI